MYIEYSASVLRVWFLCTPIYGKTTCLWNSTTDVLPMQLELDSPLLPSVAHALPIQILWVWRSIASSQTLLCPYRVTFTLSTPVAETTGAVPTRDPCGGCGQPPLQSDPPDSASGTLCRPTDHTPTVCLLFEYRGRRVTSNSHYLEWCNYIASGIIYMR